MMIQISDHFNFKKLFKFVLPSIFMMVITSIYGVIDGFFVSNFVGKTPFAAVNLIMPFIMILGGMGFMIGTGGTALVSRIIGENDLEKANRYFTLLILFAVILGVILMVVGVLIMRQIACLLGASQEMIEPCVLYGRIVAGFTPFLMLQYIFQSFLAAAEKPKLGLVVTLIAGCSNAALDALFIVGFQWGLVGAAVATGIGQFLGAIIPMVYFASKNKSLLRFTKTKFEIKPIVVACGNGSSELFTNIASSFVSMLYNFQLMKFYGENGVSAYGVIMYVQLIFLALMIGYTIGSAPIVSYNFGAQNADELKNIFKKSLSILAIGGIVLSALAQVLAIPLAKLFVGYDIELYQLTVHAFRLFSFAFMFSGVAIYSSGFFTALNNGLISAILSIMRSLVFQVTFVFLLPVLFGVNGIWWAMFATEVGATVVATIFFITYRKKYNYL
ncbi:MAG: MATE family efflux transporter [Anaeroplasmataceae bacterium]|nr:MATE family efflux transporter [Anaeroplasmataceae bacterium]